MARADFYLIDKPRFRENPLLLVCELAKMANAQQIPTLIHARSQEQAEALDELLWEVDADGFIGCKLATIFPDNARVGKPSLYGQYLLALLDE